MKTEVKTVAEWEAGAERLTNLVGWVCRTCRRYHGDDAESPRRARYCCSGTFPCPCGNLASPHCTLCDPCRQAAEQTREEQRIAAAAVVADADYPDGLYVEGYGPEYFKHSGELQEWLEDEYGERWRDHVPQVVWACTKEQIVADLYDAATANLGDNAYEDWDADRLAGVKEFQAACAAFELANAEELAWVPDFRRRVEIDWSGE